MPGPTTEYLSEQLDRVRDEVSSLGKAVEASRREAIDGLRDLGDTFVGQVGEVREHVGTELAGLRQEIGAAREGLRMDQSVIREDLVRLRGQTDELIARFDRVLGLLKSLLIALISVAVTILGAAAGAFWNASRVYHAVEDHARRIEKLEDIDRGQARLQQSLDRIEQALQNRTPAVGK